MVSLPVHRDCNSSKGTWISNWILIITVHTVYIGFTLWTCSTELH